MAIGILVPLSPTLASHFVSLPFHPGLGRIRSRTSVLGYGMVARSWYPSGGVIFVWVALSTSKRMVTRAISAMMLDEANWRAGQMCGAMPHTGKAPGEI